MRFIQLFVCSLMSFQFAFAAPQKLSPGDYELLESTATDTTLKYFYSAYSAIKKPEDLFSTLLKGRISNEDLVSLEKLAESQKTLPKLIIKNRTIYLSADGKVGSIEIVDLFAHKYSVNGKLMTLDPALPFNEQVRFVQERMGDLRVASLFRLFLPEANAAGKFEYLALAVAVGTSLLSVVQAPASTAVCKLRGLNGGQCGVIEDTSYKNSCMSTNEKALEYPILKLERKAVRKGADGNKEVVVAPSVTVFSASVDANKTVTQISQYYVSLSPEEAARYAARIQPKVRGKATKDEEPLEFDISNQKTIPILYNLEKGVLTYVQIGSNTITAEKSKNPDGTYNQEWEAYLQVAAITRTMVNKCNRKTRSFDNLLVPLAEKIDDIQSASGSTDPTKAKLIEKVKPDEVITVEESKELDAKKVKAGWKSSKSVK